MPTIPALRRHLQLRSCCRRSTDALRLGDQSLSRQDSKETARGGGTPTGRGLDRPGDVVRATRKGFAVVSKFRQEDITQRIPVQVSTVTKNEVNGYGPRTVILPHPLQSHRARQVSLALALVSAR